MTEIHAGFFVLTFILWLPSRVQYLLILGYSAPIESILWGGATYITGRVALMYLDGVRSLNKWTQFNVSYFLGEKL